MKHLMQTLLALSLLLITSCNHREFEYESSQTAYLDVVFDWTNDPDASPKSMSFFLFPEDGGIPYRYDFGGRDGGTIEVKPGTYHAVCINNEESGIAFRGEESHFTFEIYMSEATTMSLTSSYSVRSYDLPRASGLENQPLVQTPPLLWSTTEYGFKIEVRPSKSRSENPQQLVMQPNRIVDTYVVTVKNIKNIKHLITLGASLSDMADGYFIGAMTPNDNATTLPLELPHSTESSIAEGQFYTFGHCAGTSRTHKLMLYAIMNDGQKYYFEHDVTLQAHNAPDENNIYHIVIDGLDLPDPIGGGDSGGGFDPEVNDWNSIHINLPM